MVRGQSISPATAINPNTTTPSEGANEIEQLQLVSQEWTISETKELDLLTTAHEEL